MFTKKDFEALVIRGVLIGLVLVAAALIVYNKIRSPQEDVDNRSGMQANAQTASKTERDYYVSPNTFVATVVTEPQELGGGIYLLQVEVGPKENPTRYPALTHAPGWFKVGQQVIVKTYTANGTNLFRDQFHIAFAF